MLISKAEMIALQIVGEYTDAPAEMLMGKQGLPLCEMLGHGYLKFSENKSSLRLTKAGAEILSKIGVNVKIGIRSTGRKLQRKLQGAQAAMFLSSLGINVFVSSVPKSIFEPMYLSSAELRRQKYSNVLGMSKFLGLLYAKEVSYVVYNISGLAARAEIFYPQTDEDIFTREIISANNPAEILYVSDKSLYEMAAAFVETQSNKTPTEKIKHGCGFYQAIERFNVPMKLVSMPESADQLRIMLTEDYRDKLARYMLNADYAWTAADFVDSKMLGFKDGYFIVFIDFDVKKLERALSIIHDLHILVLKEQIPALKILLQNRKAKIYSITSSEAFEVLGIPPPVNMNLEQYKTAEGVGIIAHRAIKKQNKR